MLGWLTVTALRLAITVKYLLLWHINDVLSPRRLERAGLGLQRLLVWAAPVAFIAACWAFLAYPAAIQLDAASQGTISSRDILSVRPLTGPKLRLHHARQWHSLQHNCAARLRAQQEAVMLLHSSDTSVHVRHPHSYSCDPAGAPDEHGSVSGKAHGAFLSDPLKLLLAVISMTTVGRQRGQMPVKLPGWKHWSHSDARRDLAAHATSVAKALLPMYVWAALGLCLLIIAWLNSLPTILRPWIALSSHSTAALSALVSINFKSLQADVYDLGRQHRLHHDYVTREQRHLLQQHLASSALRLSQFSIAALAPCAIQLQSQLLGFITVAILYLVLKFTVLQALLVRRLDWDGLELLPRAATTSAALLALAAGLRTAGVPEGWLQPFSTGCAILGTGLLYLCGLIACSKDYQARPPVGPAKARQEAAGSSKPQAALTGSARHKALNAGYLALLLVRSGALPITGLGGSGLLHSSATVVFLLLWAWQKVRRARSRPLYQIHVIAGA